MLNDKRKSAGEWHIYIYVYIEIRNTGGNRPRCLSHEWDNKNGGSSLSFRHRSRIFHISASPHFPFFPTGGRRLALTNGQRLIDDRPVSAWSWTSLYLHLFLLGAHLSKVIQLSSSDSGHSRSSSWESDRVGFACQLPVGMWEALFGLPTCHRKVRTYGSPWGGWFVYGVLHLRICRLNKLGLILPSILMNSPQAFDASWMRKFWFLCFNLCSTREES